MGSGIAIDFALAYPQMTSALISIGPWINGYSSPVVEAYGEEVSSVLNEIIAAVKVQDLGTAVDAWMNSSFFSKTIIDPIVGDQFKRLAKDFSFWGFVHDSPRRSLDPNAAGRMSEIQAPTLVVTADNDIPVCLDMAEMIDRSVPNSRKIVMQGTGHLLHMEKPREFIQHLVSFLSTFSDGDG
jgi:pimeloyl-ACP methyl ester carboxylesterase